MNKFDEEKAKSLWYHFCTEKSCDGYDDCKLCPKAQAHPQLIEMAQWKDEQYKTAYVVTRSDLHYDEVEKVFFDEKKAEEYCKLFNENENSYPRDITKIEVTL